MNIYKNNENNLMMIYKKINNNYNYKNNIMINKHKIYRK